MIIDNVDKVFLGFITVCLAIVTLILVFVFVA